MKVLHLIGGGDIGGAKVHVLSLVKELSNIINIKIISFRPGVFSDEAHSMGINLDIVQTGTIIGDVRKVIKILKNEKYELVHSHGAKANMIAAIVKMVSNIRTITTVHSDYRLDYMESITRKYTLGLINTIALRFIDHYIAVSKSFKKMLISRNFSPDKIFVLYNGMNFSKSIKNYTKNDFLCKYGLSLSDKNIIVGILARLHPVKGLDVFLKGAKLVLEKRPGTKFLIAGEGEQKSFLIKLSEQLGISDSVFFLGWVNDPYEFMSNIDIHVMSSISESFSYTILESARLKKATISSNVGGISDLIDDGHNGFLFTPGDYEKLAEYIITLIDDSKLRYEMGKRIYIKACSRFSLENMVKTQLDIYHKLLKI